MVLLPSAIYLFSYFHRIAPAAVAGDIMRAFSATAASVGLLMSVYPWLFAAMALPAGSLTDTLGARRTLGAGALAMTAGAIAFGLAPTFGVALAGRLLVGLGSSAMLISWLRLGMAWCRPDERGRLAGFSQTVGAVGGLAGTVPLAFLVDAVGWRASFVVIGVATALAGLAVYAGVRDRPEDFGRAPVVPSPAPRPAPLREVVAAAGAVMRNRRSWPPVLVTAGVHGTFLSFAGLWVVPYLVQVRGLDRLDAAGFTAAASLGTILGATTIGWVSDRLLRRRRLAMVLGAGVYAAAWYPIAFAGDLSLPALWWLCVALGFTAPVSTLAYAVLTEVNDPARPGVAIGFVNVPSFGGVAVMQWLTGVVLDAHWQGAAAGGVRVYPAHAYELVFAVSAAVATAAALLACAVTETRCRSVWAAPGPAEAGRMRAFDKAAGPH